MSSVSESGRPLAAAFAAAAEQAGRAPSIHNTQPWRWHVTAEALDLYADPTRTLPVTDPDGRMLAVSCGAALHHARVVLAAEGYLAEVRLLPSPDQPELLARLTVTDRGPVSTEAALLAQAIATRHTDRRPTIDVPVAAPMVEELRAAAEAEGVHLHRLTDQQVSELAVAISRAEDTAAAEPELREETARWTGGERPGGTGVPGAAIPERRPETDVGERDFGRAGTLPISGEHDKAATYVVLFGDTDDRETWLRAGVALSAVWLRATELGLAVLPFSQPVEIGGTRELMNRMLAGLGYTCLALRIGHPDTTQAEPPRTPRLSFTETVAVDSPDPD